MQREPYTRAGNCRTIDRIEAKEIAARQQNERSVSGAPNKKRPRPKTQQLAGNPKIKRPVAKRPKKDSSGGPESKAQVTSRLEATVDARTHSHGRGLSSAILTQVLGDFAFFEHATATSCEVDATPPGSKCSIGRCTEQPCSMSRVYIQSHRYVPCRANLPLRI